MISHGKGLRDLNPWLFIWGRRTVRQGHNTMYNRLEQMRIKTVLPGPDAFFVAAEYEDWQIELRFIIKIDGPAYGKTNQNSWVELTNETTGLVRDKVRQFARDSSIPRNAFA
jgi:hypothetical protein